MRLYAATTAPQRQKTDCAIVGLHEGGKLSVAGVALDAALKGRLSRVIKRGDVHGKPGELRLLDTDGAACDRVLLVGLGKPGSFGRKQYRKALVSALGALAKTGARDAVSYLGEALAEPDAYYDARLAAEALGAALYRIPVIRSSRKPAAPALRSFGFAVAAGAQKAAAQRGLDHGQAIAAGTALTRDLANLPANVCTPGYLAQQAKELARAHKSVKAQVLDERELRRLKMGSFLSVTNGTGRTGQADRHALQRRPRRRGPGGAGRQGRDVRQRRHLAEAAARHGRDEVRHDRRRQRVRRDQGRSRRCELKLNLVGIVPACENMPSGRATKPGDIVRSMSGQTIEVINTDAEGRLILCDALTYARRFKPATVVDIATLTGACVIALGAHHTAVMSNDDELAGELVAAGRRAEDRCWHMPMSEEYHDQLKSNFADFANACGRDGGAITAACFLAKFTDGLRWAHLDIAGTAYLTGSHKGSTGRPVSLLMDFLLGRT